MNLKLMVMECIRGRMVTDMKESGTSASSKELVLISLSMEIHTQETILMENHMVRDSTLGPTEPCIVEISLLG